MSAANTLGMSISQRQLAISPFWEPGMLETVPTTGTDTVARNFFQIGHGGFNSDHSYALPIDYNSRVLVGDEITTIEELRRSITDGEDVGDAYLTAADNLLRRNAVGGYEVRPGGKIGHAGNIAVTAKGNVTLEAGGRHQSFAQIGHGGVLTAGDHGSWDWDGAPAFLSTTSAAPTALAGASIITLNGSDTAATLAIKYGDKISGTGIPVGATVTSISADGKKIGVSSPATLNLTGNYSFTRGTADGHITVTSTGGAIALTRVLVELSSAGVTVGNLGTQSYVQVGHGGYLSAGGAYGNIAVDAGGGNVSMYGGQSNSFAKIGHGGIGSFALAATDTGNNGYLAGVREWSRDFAAGDILGSITVNSKGDLIQRSGFRGTENFAQIGHGGYRVFATDDFLGSDDTVKGNNMDGIAGSDTYGSFVGNITVMVQGMVDAYAGQKNSRHVDGQDPLLSGQLERGMAGNRNFVMIGHGGFEARSDASGAIAVTSAVGDVRFESTGGFDAFDANSNLSTANQGNEGDTGQDNFAMIGHGGRNAEHFSRSDNPLDGDQRSAGNTNNSVEGYVMFEANGVRKPVKLTSLTNTEIAAGRLVHRESPIGWQVDTFNTTTTPTFAAGSSTGIQLNGVDTVSTLVNLQGGDTVSSLRITPGTSITGTGLTAGFVVTRIISPTQIEIFNTTTPTTATATGAAGTYTFLDSEVGVTTQTTVAPTNIGPVLTLQGGDTTTTRNIAVGSAISGPGIPALAYVTKVNSPTEIEISATPTGPLSASTVFTNARFIIDNPADRTTTTSAPSGAILQSTLNLTGSDTWRNLFLGVGSEIGGTGIAPGTVITGFNSPTSIQLSQPLTAAAAGTYTFAGNKLATQAEVGDTFGFENQTTVYQITGITPGTGANTGERLISFIPIKNAFQGTGLQARVGVDSNLFFLKPEYC